MTVIPGVARGETKDYQVKYIPGQGICLNLKSIAYLSLYISRDQIYFKVNDFHTSEPHQSDSLEYKTIG